MITTQAQPASTYSVLLKVIRPSGGWAFQELDVPAGSSWEAEDAALLALAKITYFHGEVVDVTKIS